MVRVKRGSVARSRRKKILKLAKGFNGAHSRLFRTANGQVMKALIYSYSGRKQRKRHFKKLWISRINASLETEELSYCSLKSLLKQSSISLNLKVLAQLAVFDKKTFNYLIQKVNYGTQKRGRKH